MRPLLVGELNPYGGDPRRALYPLPKNSAGGRLCRKVLGLGPVEYLRRFDRRNLCVGSWTNRAARAAASEIAANLKPDSKLVLLGAKVCAAFGWRYEPFDLRLVGADLVPLVILPHPSGRCRTWNDPDSYHRAREALRRAGIEVPS